MRKDRPQLSPAVPGRGIWLGLLVLFGAFLVAAEEADDASRQVVEAPAVRGNILGMKIVTDSLAIVVDVSESMTRYLPAIRGVLREQTPRNPTLHVDGVGIEPPALRPRIVNGTAPDTISAILALAEHTTARSILWITDMGDPPNRKGIEALEKACDEHGLQLFLLTVGNEPPPSIRKIVEGTEGYWEKASGNAP